MPKICSRYARDMPKKYAKINWGKMSTLILELGQYVPLPKFCAIWGKMSWGKMSTIILQLGQYVHLQKVCAIWGKMSWGKMSLGHFVLGHFVLGAKCPWGKMSPNLQISLSTGGDRVLEEPGCQANLVGRTDQLPALQDDPGHPQGGQLQATQGS